MKPNISYLIFAIFVIGIILQGCEQSDFLDTKPLNAITEEAIFTDPALARASLLGVYGKIPKVFGRQGGIPLDMNTRDAAHSFPWGFVNNLRNNDYNAANADVIIQNFWIDNFAYIRQTNTFLKGLETASFDDKTKSTLKAEARFLRALFYLDLYRFFSGVPIITKAQDLSDTGAYSIKRNTAIETYEFIAQEFTEVATDLPLQWAGDDKGRATKGAALGMKARVLLYAASSTNNQNLFTQVAQTAKEVIDLNLYALYPNYGQMFFDKSGANKEFIFYFNKTPNSSATYPSDTRGPNDWGDWLLTNAPVSGGAWGGLMPSQNIVDNYEMTDGKLPSESPLYNSQEPYKNRDPRFEATLYHQGSTFKGKPLEFYVGGKDYTVNGFTTSGYFIKKAIDETVPDFYAFNNSASSYLDPLLRYADILLMYAEAKNETGNLEEARIYLNMIRTRTGVNMPEIASGLSKEALREKIRHERLIELAFEESHFHDVRRWGIAPKVGSGQVYGAKITKNSDGSLKYDTQVLETRTFTSTYALFPIPQDEINKNPNLGPNNPGY